jgi:hypothetical protein
VSPQSCGAVLDAPNGVSMIASKVHDGSEAFIRRALHFATREISERPRVVPFPATWLSYFIAYRAGMTVDAIAATQGVERRHISKRLLAIMPMLVQSKIRDRVELLIAEMGRVQYEDHETETLQFPGIDHRRRVS